MGKAVLVMKMPESCRDCKWNKKRRELLERAAEEIENCYGRETELSQEIREDLKERDNGKENA